MDGCADTHASSSRSRKDAHPLVRALREGADRATPWENPVTHAAGLRVPGPLGDRLVLRAIRETGGDAAAASEDCDSRGDADDRVAHWHRRRARRGLRASPSWPISCGRDDSTLRPRSCSTTQEVAPRIVRNQNMIRWHPTLRPRVISWPVTIAIFDPFSGISGDMTLGALVGVGLEPDWLRALPDRLGLEGIGVRVDPVEPRRNRLHQGRLRYPAAAARAAPEAHQGARASRGRAGARSRKRPTRPSRRSPRSKPRCTARPWTGSTCTRSGRWTRSWTSWARSGD